MEKNFECILCKATKEYTVKKIVCLLKKAEKQFDDYSYSLSSSITGTDYENEYIDEIEEASVDNPLHDKLVDLEEILKNLNASTDKATINLNLKRAYEEFSNGLCNKCVDYLNRAALKENLKTIILNNGCTDSNEAETIVTNWINNLVK
ncbi:MAG: hypothetical protein RR894_14655 [Terrisporobacter sp.]